MTDQRLNLAILFLGLLFVLNPLYWDVLASIGVAPLVDWLAAIGMIPEGTYYLAIGGMYLLAGVLALWYADENDWGFRQLGLGVGVSLLVVWAGLVVFWWTTGVKPGVALVAFAFGAGPVMVGLLIGATSDRSTSRTLWGIAILLLLPFVGWLVTNSMAQGGPATLSGFVILFSAVLLVILDVIWGYPLYRLGRSLG